MTTDTKLNQLIINKLTQEQYDEAKAAGTLSDTELYITDSDDEALTNNNITNCITEIPQDIKLELNNGTLTLKAGSKVYVPNGFEADGTTPKFDEVVIENDINGDTDSADYLYFYRQSNTEFGATYKNNCYSGTSVPSNPNNLDFWYDTSSNKIKRFINNSWVEGFTLPICISHNTYIDQVFNGFGYIGSTVFALPGVKGLIPNGRNADGSLKNIEFVNDRVRTFTASGSGYGLTYFLTPDYVTSFFVVNSKAYAEKDTKLTTFDNNNGVWFDTKQNIMLQTTDSGATWTRVNYVSFSYMFMTNAGHLDYLKSKTVFHALDYNDKSTISSWSMPSGRFIDLTLGATGTSYTAPANGYFQLSVLNGRMIQFYNKTRGEFWKASRCDSDSFAESIECQKGDIILCYYAYTTFRWFRFYYAEGEK